MIEENRMLNASWVEEVVVVDLEAVVEVVARKNNNKNRLKFAENLQIVPPSLVLGPWVVVEFAKMQR